MEGQRLLLPHVLPKNCLEMLAMHDQNVELAQFVEPFNVAELTAITRLEVLRHSDAERVATK